MEHGQGFISLSRSDIITGMRNVSFSPSEIITAEVDKEAHLCLI